MKVFATIILSFWLVACAAQDETYFRGHPEALKNALEKCPDQAPKKVSCQKLQDIAVDLQKLMFELRAEPQQYGLKILALQQEISQQELNTSNTSEPQLIANRADLKQRLAVVRWLESPES